jgi:hypothetical protein
LKSKLTGPGSREDRPRAGLEQLVDVAVTKLLVPVGCHGPGQRPRI